MLIDDLKKRNTFIQSLLIPSMRKQGEKIYRSDNVASFLEDYVFMVQKLMDNKTDAPEIDGKVAEELFSNKKAEFVEYSNTEV